MKNDLIRASLREFTQENVDSAHAHAHTLSHFIEMKITFILQKNIAL